jgi:mono/diheme cytochrome c family protein
MGKPPQDRARVRWRAIATPIFVAAAVAACAPLIWHSAIAPIAPPPRASFAADAIVRGATLAAIGDCAVCHTATYAGGYGVKTPFGTIYATNITPNPETGIGTWSEAAFRRAMRDGIGRNGQNLYPALPYPHFTRATDADIAALYAFIMTRAPIRAPARPAALPFPLNIRTVVAGWNLFFLHPGPWQPNPALTAEQNRGAYLVEAVGHCGACHTPHNLLGAEEAGRRFGGGVAEAWYAPALGAGWSEDQLFRYLRTGYDASHGAAAGPMTPVTMGLAAVPDADVQAIAAYIASLPASAPLVTPRAGTDSAGNAVFAGACGGCHGTDAPMTRDGAPSLALSSAVNAPTARDAVQVVLHGIPWREGTAAPYMPGFAGMLSDQQVIDLVGYLRAHFSNKPAWSDIEALVREGRQT